MMRSLLAAAAVLTLTGAAYAGPDLQLAPFTKISVHGGGEVKLMYGPVQRVRVIEADMKVARIEVRGNTLDLSPCDGTCWGRHSLKVEITVPAIEAVDIRGGGSITAQGEFPKIPHLFAEVHGGGDANLRAIPVEALTADVHGGGDLAVHAIASLEAEVHGGGEVSYIGHPPVIKSRTHGGGSVHGE
jgi:Protein of unknown function (DUF2807).